MFPARLRYIGRKTDVEGTPKPKRGIPIFTVCCHGVTAYLFLTKTMSSFKTANKGYTVDFPRVYGALNKSQLSRAHQNQEGDTDIPFTVTVYLFLAKKR